MSQYIDNQAEESDGSDLSTSEPAAKRSKKLKRKHISSDEEDDELDDDARLKEEMRGFVVEEDEDDVDGNNDDDGEDHDKSDRAGSDNDDLLDDDFDLLDENFGRQVGGRVAISDDDEDDDRERINRDLFGHDEFEGEEVTESRPVLQDDYDDDSRSESDQSEGPFIVQDDGEQKRRHNKHRKSGYNDQFLDDAKEIFGVEDIDEFYDEDDVVEDEGEEGEDGVTITKPKSVKVSLWNTIEPSELAKGFVSAVDKRIIFEDRPERFQMRKTPVTEVDDEELEKEKQWIYTYAFSGKSLSKQEHIGLAGAVASENFAARYEADQDAPKKIGEALHFIRNQVYEVPFIAFYRKEHVESILMSDLWKIYLSDEKWCRLNQRKNRVKDLLRRVDQYMNATEPENIAHLRKISETDVINIDGVQNFEQLSDAYAHFQLYYGNEMKRVQEWEQKTLDKDRLDTTFAPKFKLGARTDKYLLCVQCGLGPMAEEFGLSPFELAENLTDYVKHEVRQNPLEPLEVAKNFICENFPTEDDVLKGAIYVLAQQFSREPAVRIKLREKYCARLMISVYPTKRGIDEIDENNVLWGKHYIKDKPVRELSDDIYFKYIRAKNDGLLEVKLYADSSDSITRGQTLLDECFFKEPVFHREEFFYVVEEWNKLRKEVLQMCVNEILLPVFEREAHEKLLEEAHDYVLRKCAEKMADKLSAESYKSTFRYVNDDEEEGDAGVRVMSICYSSDMTEASFALVIDQDGSVLEHLRLGNFTKRANSRAPGESQLKASDMEALRKFILRRQPHVIGINGDDLTALRLREDVTRLLTKMIESRDLQCEIPVEITNNDVAKVYMNSQMSLEFCDYPPLLRQCVSLARCILDPLIEICHLCNSDDDILFINFNPLQNEVPKRELLFTLHMECINRVNEVGVDINRCLEFPHTAGMLQFVCGLGPRKSNHLLKILKQNDNLLESRTKLVTFCHMGPKVFMNASGFIKIDTAKVSERTDAYVEVLDGSRVHPETYEWARKMAVDALEVEDADADPTAALEEILQYPDRLRDLDLDAFAEELARQGYGNKSITLYDIRAELNYRYKDLRSPHKAVEGQELYEMLIRDGDACTEGKLISGRVLYVVHRRPNEKDLENRRPTIVNSKNTWECDFCRRSDFNDISEVWNHTEKGDCPGIPVGVKVRLENGLMGFVAAKNISDNPDSSRNATQRLVPGHDQMFYILSFNAKKMQAELSCKSSDLQRTQEKENDLYFDGFRSREDKEQREKARSAQVVRNNFVKRVISHPSFHNVTFKDAERMLRNMEPGEVVVRPSAKAVNYLTITWKVTGNIYQHINIKESQKDKVYDIGKALFINGEQFEDLDEIIARHIQPMAGFAQDIMSYKYYMVDVYSEEVSAIESFLHNEKKRSPTRIPYTITASTKYPGKFVLSYLAQQKVRHEYLSVTPEGIKFRYQYFTSTDELINWFKMNYMHRPEMFKK